MNTTTQNTITIRLEIPEKLIRDIIITACEGGIGYWSQLYSYDGPAIDDNKPGSLPLKIRVDNEDGSYGEWMDLGVPEVMSGLARFINDGKYPHISARFEQAVVNYDNGDYDFDAGDADCIVQYALLGDIIYG